MLKFIFYLFLCFLFSSQSTPAQKTSNEPTSELITSFPFMQLYGGVILLKGTFADYPDSLNFILDTGSDGISLDSSRANFFKLKTIPSENMINGIAGRVKVSYVNDQTLHLPGLTIDGLNFHVADYEILSSVYGERIDGIIGYSVLSRYIIQVNYDSSVISFFTQGIFKYPKKGYLLKPFFTSQPLQTGTIKDNRPITSKLLIDMGADVCLLVSSDFITDSSVLKKGRNLYVKQAQGIGGTVDLKIGVVSQFRLGSYRFRNVPTYILNDTYNVLSYPKMTGLIGNNLLHRFNIILNYEKREIHISPNSSYNDPFDYVYTGMDLIYSNEHILIGNIAKGSPAEKAGLREEDIVVSINKAFDNNFVHYKTVLEAADDSVIIVIKRNGQLIPFDFKVKSIK